MITNGKWQMAKERMRTAVAATGVVCLAMLVCGADINPGYTFSSGEQNVTHTKLNNLVDAASINTSFFTDKAAAAPVAADSFLFYSASLGAFRRVTYDTLLFSQTNLISGQVEMNTPRTNDYVLVETAAGTFAKSSLNALTWTNADLIVNRTNWVSPNFTTTYFLAYDNGAYSKVSRSNLLNNAATILNFTNLLTRSTPANNDALLLWDTTDATNTVTTLAGLVTNTAAATVATNGDFIWGYSTNDSKVAKFTPTQIGRFTAQRSVFSNITLPGSDTVSTNAHGLAGIPQLVRAVLVCTNANHGYAVGNEVDATGIYTSGTVSACTVVDATNIYFAYTAGGINMTLCNRTNATTFQITKADWNFKVYATYFP